MAWFKVDDGLHDHRKTRRVRRSHPTKRRDVAPFGIWVLAGSWAGANGTSGFVPTEILEEWDDDAVVLAERLVAAGLWWPTVEDGEPGYGFHDWDDRNPVSEVDSGRYGNHLRWHEKRGVTNPDCDYCIGASRGDDRGESGTISPPESSPGPARPDPIPCAPATADDATHEASDRFEEFWDIYDKKQGRKKAEQKYRIALRKRGVTADLLITAAAAYISRQRAKRKHPEFTKDAVTWLNGEHWTDESETSSLVGTPYPENGTEEEQLAWVKAQPLPTDGAYYGGSAR